MGGLCEDTIQQTIETLMSGDVKKAHALNNMMSQLTQQERSIEISASSFDAAAAGG